MKASKNGTKVIAVNTLIKETSRQIMRALALSAQDATEEAAQAWLGAATQQEHVACLLDAEGRANEAAVHWVSAASCYGKVNQFPKAVSLLRAALSFTLRPAFRREIETLLRKWLPKAKKQLRSMSRKRPARVA